MDHFTCSDEGRFTMSKYLEMHHHYFNDTKAKNFNLLRKGVKELKILRQGNGYHRTHLD